MTATTPPSIPAPRNGICLEGRFLGLMRSDKGKVKGFRLGTATGDCVLKIDKYVGYALQREIELGAAVRVWARDKSDDELKVIMVVPLAPKDTIEVPFPTEPVAKPKAKPCKIQVCRKGSCHKRGSAKVWQALQETLVASPDLPIVLEATGCQKACKQGPAMRVLPEKQQHTRVSPGEATAIARQLVKRHGV